jgi:spore maturation protein B
MHWISIISIWMIPTVILLILVMGAIKKVPTYESFVEGGKDGIKITFSIIPYLIGMMVAISIFRASGAMDLLIGWMKPVLNFLGVPSEIVPLALIRPISGNASLGMVSDLIATYGPDSFIGKVASTIQGSTDTTLYVLTVYFGAVGIKKMGDALKVGLWADLVGIGAAILLAGIMF